ncbi:tripartite tricarboxylate transporter permease [Candidatus Woesearchaeota archaeon]|nr:tripartite tricarboxylate transporter permease [Candidatus Woesearchaeota archaeon]
MIIISFLLAVVCGVVVGSFTGVTPGLHMNLVASLIVSLHFPGNIFVLLFLVSLSVTHTFLDAIPAVFLGFPSSDTIASFLPAHRFLLNGRGFDAVALLTFGSFLGLLFSLIFSPVVFFVTPFLFSFLRPYTFWIVFFILFFLVLRDYFPLRAFIVVLLSGVLGFYVLRFSNVSEPLLPLLSGLFGVSSIISGLGVSKIPLQFSTRLNFSFFSSLKGCILGFFSGFLPGVGSAQMAFFSRSKSDDDYLLSVGALNTSSLIFTIIFASVLSRSRSGTGEALLSLASIDSFVLLALLLAVLISGCAAFFSSLLTAKFFSLYISSVPFRIISFVVLFLIFSAVFLVSGIPGISVLLLSSGVGIFSIILGCSRSHAMACIIVPVLFLLW